MKSSFSRRVGAGCGRGLTRRITRLHQRGLADERFLVAQCTQRLVETVAVLRIVNRPERFGSVHQPMFHTKRFRHDVGDGGGKRFRPCLPVGLRRVEFPMLRVAGIGAMQCTGACAAAYSSPHSRSMHFSIDSWMCSLEMREFAW